MEGQQQQQQQGRGGLRGVKGEPLITVNIKTLDSTIVSVQVEPFSLTAALKAKLRNLIGIPEAAQRLIFQGKVLKDDATLDSLGVKDNATLHCVQKAPQPQPPSAAAAPSSSGATPPSSQSGNGGILPGNSLLVGSISPQGSTAPSFQNLLGNLFQTVGGSPSTQPSQASHSNGAESLCDGVVELAALVDRLSASVAQLRSGEAGMGSTTRVHHVGAQQQSSGVDALGKLLATAHTTMAEVQSPMGQLSMLLQTDSRSIPTQPREVQHLVRRLPAVMEQMAAVLLLGAQCLNGIQLGDNLANTALSSIPNNSVVHPSPSLTIEVHCKPFQSTPTPTSSNAPTLSSNQMPIFTISHRQSTTNAQQSNAQQANPSTQVPAQPPMNLTNLLSTIAQVVNNDTPASTGLAHRNLTQQEAPNIMQNVFSAVQSILQQNAAHQESNGRNSSTAPDLLSQLFNLAQGISPSQERSLPRVPTDFISSVQMSEMIAHEEEDSNLKEGLLGDMLQKILDILTIPDMLHIMSGDWSPLEPVHPVLREHLLQVLDGDTSEPRLSKLVDEITSSLKTSLESNGLPPGILEQVKPGYDIIPLSTFVIEKHTLSLLATLLEPCTPQQPAGFAVQIKEWTAEFVEELVTVLSQAFRGGVSDASLVINYFLQQHLSFLGPEYSELGTNMITSYIMKTYSNSEVIDGWDNIFKVDEIRQSISPPQPPLSDSYLSGGSVGQRKAMRKLRNPGNYLADRFRDAIHTTQSNADKEMLEKAAKELSTSYLESLAADIKETSNRKPN